MRCHPKALTSVAMAMAFASLSAATASSQEVVAGRTLLLELNALQPSDGGGCRLTFVITNGLGGDLTKAAFEIALFGEGGVVDRMTVLDFKDLPAGKTKVSRFDLPGADCAKVTRVLINSATECSGTGIEPAACIRQLKTDTKAKIAFGS